MARIRFSVTLQPHLFVYPGPHCAHHVPTEGIRGIMSTSGAHRRTSRTALVFIQLIVFVMYILGPTAAFAEEPTPEPSAPETTAPEPTVAPEPSVAPDPTPAPTASSPAPQTAPTIASDKGDYPPGGYVTLTGDNWQPGETVTIWTNDDQGETWRRDVTVTADSEGGIRDEFNLPGWFVATYIVTASGPLSGIAQTMFTDGNLKVASASGVHFGHTTTLFSGSTNCTGSAGSPVDKTADANGSTVGVGNNESLLITANLNANAPNATATFDRWDLDPNGPSGDAVVLATGYSATDRTICVVGFQSGSRDLVGLYVTNLAPAIASNHPSVSVDEGQTASNGGTWSDGNSGDTISLSASVGTVTKSGTNAAGTWSWSYGTTDGPTQSQTVTITANDGTTSASTAFALTVSNVQPTATFSAPTSVNEGSAIVLSLTSPSDPSSVDTTAGFTFAFDCGSGYGAFSATASASCPTTDDGSRTVKGTIKDKDGGSNEYTASVTVANVPPSIAISGAASVNEGSVYSLTLGAVTDPGADTVSSYVVHWGDGSSTTYTSDGVKTHTFADGPSTYAITVDLVDEDGTHLDRANGLSVQVNNVAPSIALSGADTADEGDTKTYSYLVSDPGQDTHTVTTACGLNGDKVAASDTYNPLDGSGSFQCFFPDGQTTTNVTATVTDSDGASDTDNQLVVVIINNVDPVVTLTGAASANEGDTVSYSYTVDDPGAETFALDAETCDGGSLSNSSFDAATGAGSFDCTFADGPATHTVSVTVSDGDGGSDSDSIEVTVANVAPQDVDAGEDATVDEGDLVSLSGTFSDPGSADTHSYLWSVVADNGQVIADGTDQTFSFTPNDNGSYSVTFTVTDDDGGANSDTITITVANVAPVVTLDGAASSSEGQTQNYTFSWTDPGADTWSRTVSCGATGAISPGAFNDSTKSGTFSCTWADDAPTGTPSDPETVSVTVSDDDGGTDTDSKMVTIHNLAPVIDEAATTLTFAPGAGTATSSLTYTDAGVPDVSTAVFNYTWTGTSSGTETHTYTDRASTATVVDTLRLAPGCYSITAEMSVTDDDTGTDTTTRTSGASSIDFYDAEFRAPIKENVRNIAKYGNVVPVKVELMSMCVPGSTITNRTLHVTIVLGDQTDNANDTVSDTMIAESVSGADNGTQMRVNGGGYIYNLSTRGMIKDNEYTVRIRDGSSAGPIILKALFMPKK